MLTKSGARAFFVLGTSLCFLAFVLLTCDTIGRVPAQTNAQRLTPSVVRGKHLWERSNCMGCHTLLGEGAYYAPELTKVHERRGPAFIAAMLRDPQKMYPGQRRMQTYGFAEPEIADLVAFLQWIGEMDLNGFPPRPQLSPVAVPASTTGDAVAERRGRPQVFNQLCIACHMLGGQGGVVGPPLDSIGLQRDAATLATWLRDPLAVKPDSKMPKLPLTEADIAELIAFLTLQKKELPK